MTTIVGVHGVGNYHPDQTAAKLATTWTTALTKAFDGAAPPFTLHTAYYAPRLRGPVAQGATDDPDLLAEPIQAAIRDWLGLLDLPEVVAQGRLTQPIRGLLDYIAKHRGLDSKVVRWFVGTFFGEVTRYLDPDNQDQRHAARQVVQDTITEYRPRIVIAHSLGSVVTYEALWSLPDQPIELLLTLGSPLAMPDIVYPHLQGHLPGSRPRRPPNVRRWLNIADRGDLIAIPRGLGVRFDGVDGDLKTSISAFDFHKVRNYLADRTTSDTLLPYLIAAAAE